LPEIGQEQIETAAVGGESAEDVWIGNPRTVLAWIRFSGEDAGVPGKGHRIRVIVTALSHSRTADVDGTRQHVAVPTQSGEDASRALT
jgi:hypothetical protein